MSFAGSHSDRLTSSQASLPIHFAWTVLVKPDLQLNSTRIFLRSTAQLLTHRRSIHCAPLITFSRFTLKIRPLSSWAIPWEV